MKKPVQLLVDLTEEELRLPEKQEEEILAAVASLLLQLVKPEVVREVNDEFKS